MKQFAIGVAVLFCLIALAGCRSSRIKKEYYEEKVETTQKIIIE